MTMIYITPEWSAVMVAQFEAATTSIHISALSMHPPKKGATTHHTAMFAALENAIKRGVRVKVWLAAPHANHPAAALNEATRQMLVALGIECRLCGGGRLLHAKTAVVDMASVWIGSGNFTASAMHVNHECYFNTICAGSAARWVSYLESMK